AGRWQVSGVFDLHEARFADGTLDLVRQSCSYLDTEPGLAEVFADAYRANVPKDRIVPARMALYVLNDRMKFWEFFGRPERRATWLEGHTFRSWTQRYLDAILGLL